MSRLYETDFYAWTQEQAALLDGRHFDALDLANLVEEITSLGKSEQRAMRSYWEGLLLHLLKWHYEPSYRSGSWCGAITRARQQLTKLGVRIRRCGASDW